VQVLPKRMNSTLRDRELKNENKLLYNRIHNLAANISYDQFEKDYIKNRSIIKKMKRVPIKLKEVLPIINK
jgi:hypothetical protein